MKSNISINCILNNSLKHGTYYICIYTNGQVIYSGYKRFNEILNLKLSLGYYKIILLTNKDLLPIKYMVDIVITRNNFKNLIFFFYENNNNNNNAKIIDFLVTDKFYVGLPIEKGELIYDNKPNTYY